MIAAVVAPISLLAQTSDCHSNLAIFKTNFAETTNLATNCGSGLFRCYPVEELDRTIRLTNPACDPLAGSCDVELVVTLRYPGNRQNFNALGAGSAPHAVAWWYTGATPPACDPTSSSACSGDAVGACGAPSLDSRIDQDRVETFLRISTSCQSLADGVLPPQMGDYSILAYSCATAPAGCRHRKEVAGLSLSAEAVAAAIGCPRDPPPTSCSEPDSCLSCHAGANVGGRGAAAGGAAPGGRSGRAPSCAISPAAPEVPACPARATGEPPWAGTGRTTTRSGSWSTPTTSTCG